ncbi:MAG: hypothetical protein AAF491_10620 [Verrucomicrobiota bacterium]
MNSDFKDLLVILDQEDVRYLVVGGYAVIFHSQPRYTRDLNIWLEPTAENAGKIMRAFALFGISTFGLDQSDFEIEGTQLNIGMPPVAIDFLTSLPSVAFDQAWKNRFTRRQISAGCRETGLLRADSRGMDFPGWRTAEKPKCR